MTRPPRFLISGYYGFGNAGDEAMLAGLIEGFGRLRPDAELTVLSGSPADTVAEHGVPAVPRGLGSIRRHLPLCDVFVSGGGGLVQDVSSWRSPLYYLAALGLARRARRPIACVGQSIGPLRRTWVRSLARRELARVNAIAVRDQPSRELLSELGIAGRVEVTADLSFLLPKPGEAETETARQEAGIAAVTDPMVAVALRSRPGADAAGAVARVAAAIDGACERIGLRPLLVPMQPSQDLATARAAATAMPSGRAIVAPPLRAKQALALISSCRMVVAMRLHALAFGALSGLPLVAVSYDPKVNGLMAQLGLSAAADIHRLDADDLMHSIGENWAARAEVCRRIADRLTGLRSLALRNVEVALSLLPRV